MVRWSWSDKAHHEDIRKGSGHFIYSPCSQYCSTLYHSTFASSLKITQKLIYILLKHNITKQQSQSSKQSSHTLLYSNPPKNANKSMALRAVVWHIQEGVNKTWEQRASPTPGQVAFIISEASTLLYSHPRTQKRVKDTKANITKAGSVLVRIRSLHSGHWVFAGFGQITWIWFKRKPFKN